MLADTQGLNREDDRVDVQADARVVDRGAGLGAVQADNRKADLMDDLAHDRLTGLKVRVAEGCQDTNRVTNKPPICHQGG